MSKISLEGNASGSGTLTIAAPNTNSSFTLSLPSETGTIITQNSTPAFASTIGVGGATAAASGAGITFPATVSASSDANTLDDYEEGTWTPVAGLGITTNSGTPAYSGSYTKIGRLVYITIRQTAGNITVAIDNVAFSGLPFVPGLELQACSITNGNPSISGTGLIYLSGTGVIFAGFAAASQTSYTVTGVYSI